MAGGKLISGTIASAPPFLNDTTLACRTGKPDLWFPDKETGVGAKQAVELCRRCPKVAECLDWALETRQAYGIYGATTANQRRQMLRDRQGRRPE